MPSLYELSAQAEQLLDLLTDEEIDEQTFNDTLEAMGAVDKVENVCKVVNCLSADSQMFKNEIQRCQKRKKTIDNNIDRLKKSLDNFLTASGQEQLKAGVFTVSKRKSTAVHIIDEDKLPDEFLVAQKPKADLTAIKTAIKEGKVVPGAEIEERENIQIR